ncbi:MAG: LysR family transcriptional regulator [Oscillospiraceae bacterium]|jgi:DNA-binding transcriptional LysR family regulator|nr:LysR family transcriptional regulator [Oscillospiraceae bacterium]
MTLQTLEYFIAVAQYRNFTKAAQACHVTQPALSRAIRGLEEELGCALLVRAGRTVTLTPEGEVCLTEAKRVLQQCEELKLRVREAERKNQRPLRVGYLIVSHLNAFMQCLGRYGMAGPLFNLETIYGTTAETKERFASGEVDAIILPEPCITDLAEIEWAYITRSCLYAIIHKANPLYEREWVTLDELREQPFIMWKERNLPLLCAAHIQACREAGFTPRVVGEGEKMGDVLAQVTLHNAVALANQVSSAVYPGDCRFIPVADSQEKFGTVCVWRKGDLAPQLTALKEILAVQG